MQMLTEPMTAADRAQARAEREAWGTMENRIAELEAENADLRRLLRISMGVMEMAAQQRDVLAAAIKGVAPEKS